MSVRNAFGADIRSQAKCLFASGSHVTSRDAAAVTSTSRLRAPLFASVLAPFTLKDPGQHLQGANGTSEPMVQANADRKL